MPQRPLNTFTFHRDTVILVSVRNSQCHCNTIKDAEGSAVMWLLTDLPRRPPGPAQRSTEDGHAAGAVPTGGAGGPLVATSSLALSSPPATAAADGATAGSILHGDLSQQHIL